PPSELWNGGGGSGGGGRDGLLDQRLDLSHCGAGGGASIGGGTGGRTGNTGCRDQPEFVGIRVIQGFHDVRGAPGVVSTVTGRGAKALRSVQGGRGGGAERRIGLEAVEGRVRGNRGEDGSPVVRHVQRGAVEAGLRRIEDAHISLVLENLSSLDHGGLEER